MTGPPTDHPALTQEELRERLNEFEDNFEALIRRACDDLVQHDGARAVRRLTLIWQMRILPMSRAALDQENPLGSLLDLATLCIRQQRYLKTGDGKDLFGPNQPIAVRASEQAAAEIERLAARVLPKASFEATWTHVRRVAEGHPLRGEFSGAEVRVAHEQAGDTVLQNVLAIPLAPFRWLGGVDETAQAIKGFTQVADRLTDVVAGLAADARLQTQLLLLETEDLETVRQGLESFERLAASSERMVATAESLPSDFRGELTAASDDLARRIDDLDARMTRLLGETETRATAATDHAAWRIAQLIALVFVLALGYRLIGRRAAGK